jgi:4-hydroxybenzoyl-CoA thioesterase
VAFTSIHKIRFDDVDGAGIVYYPQFFHLCHATFEDFFDTAAPISYPELVGARRLGFPTVAIQSEFYAPLSYGDIAIVALSVHEIGKSSLKLGYDIRRKRDGTLCFHADITTVLVDIDTLKPTSIPPELREIFERYFDTKTRTHEDPHEVDSNRTS